MEYPSQETVQTLLDYNPKTGVFTWKHRCREWFSTEKVFKTFNTRDVGKPAGNYKTDFKGNRAIRIRLLGQNYFAHRLAWIYMIGHPVPKEIDHANGDGWDNKWCNIRSGDNGVNHCNKSMLKNSTSGIMGVSWHKQSKKWRAYMKKGQKQIALGLYNTKDEAKAVVKEARRNAGFDDRHGEHRPY